MTKWSPLFGVFAIVFSGCAASAPQPDKPNVALAAQAIKQVDYEKPLTPELLQPPSLSELESIDAGPALSDSGLTLPVLEELAFSSNPSVTQAEARVQALRGKLVQVGLPPNPTVGYVAGEIGNDGASGQQGGFVGQEIITASKLQRNRAVVGAEIHKAEQEQAAIIQKVRTDVRTGYYNTLLAQRRVELAEELVRITTETVDASRALLNAEEIPVAGLLQTQVRLKNAQTMARTSKNALRQAWRGLAAVVGRPDLAPQTLVGDIRQLPQSLDWEEQLKRLQTQSPEVAIAMAEVERTRYALDRATVEAIPDINTQLSVQYDDATQDTIVGVQLSVPLPMWDRNQGGIQQAQAEVSGAKKNVDRVMLSLNQRLSTAFRRYTDATVTAENYASDILPLAGRTLELVQRGYKQGEIGYLDLLAAQQTFSQTNLAYLDALGALWGSYLQIDGLLLEGSLN